MWCAVIAYACPLLARLCLPLVGSYGFQKHSHKILCACQVCMLEYFYDSKDAEHAVPYGPKAKPPCTRALENLPLHEMRERCFASRRLPQLRHVPRKGIN